MQPAASAPCCANRPELLAPHRVLRFPLERVAFPQNLRRFLDDLTTPDGAA